MTEAKDCFRRANALAEDEETVQRVEECELQLLYAELMRDSAQDKPANIETFRAALDRFERLARRIKMTHTREGGADFEEWVAGMRKLAE